MFFSILGSLPLLIFALYRAASKRQIYSEQQCTIQHLLSIAYLSSPPKHSQKIGTHHFILPLSSEGIIRPLLRKISARKSRNNFSAIQINICARIRTADRKRVLHEHRRNPTHQPVSPGRAKGRATRSSGGCHPPGNRVR